MALSLPALPQELLEHIMSNHEAYLCPIRNLRYTCSEIYYKTHYWFGDNFMRDLKVQLTRKNMDVLQGFASNPVIACCVRGLTITNLYDDPIGSGYLWVRNKNGNLVEPFPDVFMTQLDSLLRKGFINCNSVSLVSSTAHGHAPPNNVVIHPLEAGIFIFKTLVASNRPLFEVSITIGTKNDSDYVNTWVDSTYLETEEFKAAWAQLRKLSIASSGNWQPACVLNLLSNTLRVESLSLNPTLYWFHWPPENPGLFHHFLSSPSMLQPQRPLSELKLQNTCFSYSHLSSLLLQLGPMLQKLSLHNVRLLDRNGCWLPFVNSLREHLPRLSYCMLQQLEGPRNIVEFPSLQRHPWLKEEWYGACTSNRKFGSRVVSDELSLYMEGEDNTDKIWVYGFCYSGSSMAAFLKKVEETAQYDTDNVHDIWFDISSLVP